MNAFVLVLHASNANRACFQDFKVNALTLKAAYYVQIISSLAACLPIDYFYFEDFQWLFFGKTIRQRQQIFYTQNDMGKMMQCRY